MDSHRFDELVHVLGEEATRRMSLRLLAGGALGAAAGWLGLAADTEARRKKKKKKRRGGNRCYGSLPVRCAPTAAEPNKFCFPRGADCCSRAEGGGACPPGTACCLPNPLNPVGACAPPDAHCCTASEGGGYCPDLAPTCCPPTPVDPLGLCVPSGFVCCSGAAGGGYCGEGQTCCPPIPEFPNGFCTNPGVPCLRSSGGPIDPAKYHPRQMERPAGAVAKQ